MALSDREKRALAAERRILASSTENGSAAGSVVLSRCYQCGADMSGKACVIEYCIERNCHMILDQKTFPAGTLRVCRVQVLRSQVPERASFQECNGEEVGRYDVIWDVINS